MNEIFVARKAFDASLTISALAMSVRTTGAPNGEYRSTTASPAQSPSSPTTTRSGCMKSRTADPSLRNSGQDTYEKPSLPRSLKPRLIVAPVPAGTVDFITSAWRSVAGIASTTAWTADRSASPEYIGGVPTATSSKRACSSAPANSVEKCIRSRLRASSSSSPGS